MEEVHSIDGLGLNAKWMQLQSPTYNLTVEFSNGFQAQPSPLVKCLFINTSSASKNWTWAINLQKQQGPQQMHWIAAFPALMVVVKPFAFNEQLPRASNNIWRGAKVGLESSVCNLFGP